MTATRLRSRTEHLAFRAMSTDVTVTVVGGGPRLLAWAQDRIARLESRWTRFRPDSEIGRLNDADGGPVIVSDDTIAAVRAACAAWLATDGRFDPTVHDSLLRLGYDDTIDVVRERGGGAVPDLLPAPGCLGITFDETTGVVRLPRGVRLDLGGIGKGLAADLTVAGLLELGAAGALVSVGGDLRVAGEPPNGHAWVVDVEDPRTERPVATVELVDGGVATSTTLRRRWRLGQRPHHHLVAPASGASTATDVVGVTVVADTAAWADALSKVPFVEPGAQRPFERAGALVMHADGRDTTIGRFPAGAHRTAAVR